MDATTSNGPGDAAASPPTRRIYRADPTRGVAERALMRAVLADAVQCLLGQVGAPQTRVRLAVQARRWIVSRDPAWPFSFDNICRSLDLEPASARHRLLAAAPAVPDETPRRPRTPPPRVEEIIQLLRSGERVHVIAARLGISPSRVSTLSGGLRSRLRAERTAEILALRRMGWTPRALAARFALSVRRVERICVGLRAGPPAARGPDLSQASA